MEKQRLFKCRHCQVENMLVDMRVIKKERSQEQFANAVNLDRKMSRLPTKSLIELVHCLLLH